jgi:hypothetical protein
MEVPDSSSDVPGSNQPFPELPMSKDSNLLSPMSRALLRAARAGCIYIRNVNKGTEEDDKEAAETGETAAATRVERSFTARKWSVVPKHMEPPEVEFLAKRRQGLPSLYGASGTLTTASNNVVNASPQMRKTKIRKVNPATGDVSIYDVWVPEGHKVEGEIDDNAEALPEQKDVTVTKQTPAPGTVDAESVVVASAGAESASKPPGPPAPKRKGRKIGRGRKKRVMFAPGEGADAATVHGIDGTADERMPVDEEFEEDEDEEDEEGEGEEEGEEDDENTREEAAAIEAKSPGIAAQEHGTASATEQTTPSIDHSAENQHPASDPQPSSTAAEPSEEPAPEVPQAPSPELPDSTGLETPVQEAARASSPEKSQTPQELPRSKPASPAISATVPELVPSPAVDQDAADAPKNEAPEDIPEDIQVPQTTEPVIESKPVPMVDAMEGVEPTNTAEDLSVPEQAPVLGKAEDEVMEQAEIVETLEVIQTAEDVPPAPAPAPVATTEEVASAPAVPEAIVQQGPEASAEGSVDLLGTLEASLGEQKEKVSAEQGEATGSPSAEQEQDHPQTTTTVPPPPSESTSISAPAVSPAPTPTPDISAEVKAEPTDTEGSEPQLQTQPEPVSEPGPAPEATENAIDEEKKDESEA